MTPRRTRTSPTQRRLLNVPEVEVGYEPAASLLAFGRHRDLGRISLGAAGPNVEISWSRLSDRINIGTTVPTPLPSKHDKFPAYQLFVENRSGEPRILILTYRTNDLEREGLPTYEVPSDAKTYLTEVVVTRGPRGDETDTAGVFVFDRSCRLLETLVVSANVYSLSLNGDTVLTPIQGAVPSPAVPLRPVGDLCDLP